MSPEERETSVEEAQGTGRDETELERIDRNLNELLQELRVALPGVQVLFAFLLILPFNDRFADVTPFERDVYLVTLLATALASVLLITDVLFTTATTVGVSAGTAIAFAVLWYAIPLERKRKRGPH